MYARKLQEVLGGQYGEITVGMQYAFQSWNIYVPGKYRDLLFGVGSEEFGHVEILATMIAQLLEKAPVGVTEGAMQDDPTVAARGTSSTTSTTSTGCSPGRRARAADGRSSSHAGR